MATGRYGMMMGTVGMMGMSMLSHAGFPKVTR